MDVIEFFKVLTNSTELIRIGGYAALAVVVFTETGLLVGFFLPGDSLLVTAGLFAAAGHLDIVTLIVLLVAAAILGDSTGYLIGRSTGPVLFRRPDSRVFRRDHLLRSRVFYERHGGKTVVLARFVPVVRTFVPVLAGVSGMKASTFTLYNVSGGLLWVGSMTMTGYLLGRAIPGIGKYIELVIAVVVALSLVPVAVEAFRARRRRIARLQSLREAVRQVAHLVEASRWDWKPRALRAIAAGLESARRAVAIVTGDAPSRCAARVVTEQNPRVELVVDATGPSLSEAEMELALHDMRALYPAAVEEVGSLRGAPISICNPEGPSHCWTVGGAHVAIGLEDSRPDAVRIVVTVSPLDEPPAALPLLAGSRTSEMPDRRIPR